MSCVQDRVSNLVVQSTTAGKQVFSATMYIPSKALELTGEVFISSKNFVFAFTKVKQKKVSLTKDLLSMLSKFPTKVLL